MARMQAGDCQLVFVLWDFENVLPPDMIDGNRVHCCYHIGDSLAKSGHKFAAEILRRRNSLPTTKTAVLDGVLVVAEWAKRLYMKRLDRQELFQRSHLALSRVHYLQLGDCPGKRWKKEADHKIQEAMGCFAAKCRALNTAGVVVLISSDKDFDSAVHEARQQGIDVIIIHNKEVDPYFLEKGTAHIEWHNFLSAYIQPHLKYQLRSGKPEQYGPAAGRGKTVPAGRTSRRVAGTPSQYSMTAAAAAAPPDNVSHMSSPMSWAAAGARHMPVTPEKHAPGAHPRYYELEEPCPTWARSGVSPPRWPGSYQAAAAAEAEAQVEVEEEVSHLDAGEGEEQTEEDDCADEVTEWETEAGSDGDDGDDGDDGPLNKEAEPSEWEDVSEEGQDYRQECRVQ